MTHQADVRSQNLALLRQQLDRLESTTATRTEGVLPTGCAALDQLLPGGGFQAGRLVEWLSAGPGAGASSLSLRLARDLVGRDGILVVVDGGDFYPPAAAALGIDLSRLIVIRPTSHRDACWAWHQVLSNTAVKVAWGRLDLLDARHFRRLQLAAEQGGCVGFIVRPEHVRGSPSWADLQFHIRPLAALDLPINKRGLHVELVRCRSSLREARCQLLIDEGNGRLEAFVSPATQGSLRQQPNLPAPTAVPAPN